MDLINTFDIKSSKSYFEYDLAALISTPIVNLSLLKNLEGVAKAIYPIVATQEISKIINSYPKHLI
jgi:hypothetical protein